MVALQDVIGEPVTQELVDQLYKAADIMQAQEATLYALFDLAEDAIADLEGYDPAAAARHGRTLKTERNAPVCSPGG